MNIEKLAESAEKALEFAKNSKKSSVLINPERFMDILNYSQFNPSTVSVKYLNSRVGNEFEHKLTYKEKTFVTRTKRKIYDSDDLLG